MFVRFCLLATFLGAEWQGQDLFCLEVCDLLASQPCSWPGHGACRESPAPLPPACLTSTGLPSISIKVPSTLLFVLGDIYSISIHSYIYYRLYLGNAPACSVDLPFI